MHTRISAGSGRHARLHLLSTIPLLLGAGPQPVVEVEEVVTRYTPADNGAGPLWCYGAPLVVRHGADVYASVIETGTDVPPLSNTRWQLWRRTATGWRLAQSEKEYRQREPCPIGVFSDGPVFLSVNPSQKPPGTKYGPCLPLVLEFDPASPSSPPKINEPAWADGTHFTDHSYRGFAADGPRRELLLLNINATTGAQFVSHRDAKGTWHVRGKIEFPIRSCYSQVALRDCAAHVLAIGDIVEPVEEWRKLKKEKTGRDWDYVFRRLFYARTPDIARKPFAPPVEIDSVEKTGGNISNLDLHVDEAGAAHVLYLKRSHQYEFLRDRYSPGQPMTTLLQYAVLRASQVIRRETLAESTNDPRGFSPSFARFVVVPGESLHLLVAGSREGKPVMVWMEPTPGKDASPVPLEHPFRTFFTNTPRGGSAPSKTIDLFGTAEDALTLRYARIRLP